MKKLLITLTLILCCNFIFAQNTKYQYSYDTTKSVVFITDYNGEQKIVDYISYEEDKNIKLYAIAGFICLNTLNTLDYLNYKKTINPYNQNFNNNFNYFGTLATSTLLLTVVLIRF